MTAVASRERTCRIHVGTSGFSFKTWVGNFYPHNLSSDCMLPFYASHFNTVEVNYTFYRMPSRATIAGLARKTPDHFRFFLKAHQSFTHDRDLSHARPFLHAIEPMLYTGKLAGLLFQFPQSFRNNLMNRQHLRDISKRFNGHLLAVEFRHRSWAMSPVFSFLEDHGLAMACVDEPQISSLFPRMGVSTGDVGYVRFHSRNPTNWYRKDADRYDYLYTHTELREWMPLFETIAQRSGNIFVYFNNCHQGQAVQNAKAMRQLIKQLGPSLSPVPLADTASHDLPPATP